MKNKFIRHTRRITKLSIIIMLLYIIMYYLLLFTLMIIYRTVDLPNWVDLICHIWGIITVSITINSYETATEGKDNS